MRTFFTAIWFLGVAACVAQEPTGSRFIAVQLAHGITIDLPKSWMLLNGGWNAALDTAIEAKMDLAKLPNVMAAQVNLVSIRSMPEQTFATLRIDYSRRKTSPENVANMTKEQLVEFDEGLKKLMPQMVAPEKILVWHGTVVESFSGHPATTTHYVRSGAKGPVKVWIRDISLKNGEGSLSLNTSYRESEEFLWKAILERSIKSIKVP